MSRLITSNACLKPHDSQNIASLRPSKTASPETLS